MKKHIFMGVALLGAMACGSVFAASPVKSLDALSNTATYTLKRLDGAAGATVAATAEGTVAAGTASGDNALWSIHHNEELDMYFFYNVGTGKFISSADGKAVLSELPIDLTTSFIGKRDAWLVVNRLDGASIGLIDKFAGTNIIAASDSSRVSDGCYFSFTPGRELTADEQAAVEKLTSTEAIKAATVERLKAFIAQAEAFDNDGKADYAGGYDVEPLREAVANPSAYSVTDMRALLSDARVSRMPKAGHYYRIKNYVRPTANKLTNILGLNRTSGGFVIESLTKVQTGNTGTKRAEDLALFTFEPQGDNASVKIRAAANGVYLDNNAGNVGWATADAANIYTLELEKEDSRLFGIRQSANRVLNCNPSGGLTTYSMEDASRWWIEEIKEIPGVKISNGYAAMILPCNVELPAGATAYIIDHVSNDKFTLKEIGASVPANCAFIIKTDDPSVKTIDLAVVPGTMTLEADNKLRGTNVYLSAGDPRYELSTDADGNPVFNKKTTKTVKANVAYIPAEFLTDGADALTFDATGAGIDSIDGDAIDTTDSEGDILYDIQGRRITKPAKGLYINATKRAKRVAE